MVSPGRQSKRLLVVEDDILIALMIQEMLQELGHVVSASASQLDHALTLAETQQFDGAILDLNLDGASSFAVADMLAANGIPFVFASGIERRLLPERFSGVAVVGKPFGQDDLVDALATILS